ncbi:MULTISPECIES: 30S ribosomal protein S9 [unclassified Amycolatopsis]|uniref:30S ribosomal protein S9 n=1 Tax=unclassified Amycolatopsis TaxID=2618356 RepID=UPI002E139580|nr:MULTISPECIES: 30S ribosomal protein S9 [unclassified Amycolatopsis]WSJ75994.1 30S ribosomal protein S9 [Amycolatopsis sp. NBC_01307]WSK80401.1 30S ribosomal protein S9 [Amycolatopsis sp. NBC_01286]
MTSTEPETAEVTTEATETGAVETPEATEAPETTEAPEAAVATSETPVATSETPVATSETPAATSESATAPRPSRAAGGNAQTVGRRKEAVVRVRVVPGTGEFKLNGRTLEEYFPNKVHQQLIKDPLVLVEKPDAFDIFANLHGGGVSGQAGALRLAIARALIEVDADDRPALKKAGFLTRDARATERKKYGLKKARKAPQYSKR